MSACRNMEVVAGEVAIYIHGTVVHSPLYQQQQKSKVLQEGSMQKWEVQTLPFPPWRRHWSGGVKCRGRGEKIWGECVSDDMVLLGLQPEWTKKLLLGMVEETYYGANM